MPKRPRGEKIKSHIYVRRGTATYDKIMRVRIKMEKRAGCALSWAQVLESLVKRVRV